MKNSKSGKTTPPEERTNDSPSMEGEDGPEAEAVDIPQILSELQASQTELEIRKAELANVERDLQESRDKCLILYDFAPAGYITLNRKGIIIEANLTLAELLGCNKQNLIGSEFMSYIMPDSQNTFASHLNTVLESGTRQICELQLKNSDSSTFFTRVESVAVRDTKGCLSQCRSTITDITIQKKYDDIVRYHSIVADISYDAIIATDKELNITRWNRAAETVFGWQAEEVLERHPSSQVKARVLDFLKNDEVMESITENGSWTGKTAVVKRDGSQSMMRISTGIIWDSEGKFDGIAAIYREINISEPREEPPIINDIEIKAQQRVQQSLEGLQIKIKEIVQTMAYIGEVKDPYTAGHQRRVAQLSYEIARCMGLPEDQNEGLTMAAFVHDIGKIHIPVDILSKPGKLTKPEFDMLKDHVRVGHEILKSIKFPWPVAKIVLQHHERLDGSGYPFGLSGDLIIMEARILAVADVVEAMSSDRPYRPALGLEKAFSEINSNKGILYDPQVVDACIKVFNDKGFRLN